MRLVKDIAPADAERVAAQVMALAANGESIEVIARKTGISRYRVELLVGVGPAGRHDVPYRYRALLAGTEIAERYGAGQSAEQIAHDLGISVTPVFDVLHRDGVPLRGKRGSHRRSYADVLTAEFLRDTYVEQAKGTWKIAMAVGCSETTIRNWLRRHGIPVHPMSTRRRVYDFPPDLLDEVSASAVGVEYAAELVGCSRTELARALRRSGRTLPYERRPALTRALLKDLYVQRSLSCPEIAAETGWAIGTIRSKLHEFGIPRRIGRSRRSTHRAGGGL